jgi:recombination protein RecR
LTQISPLIDRLIEAFQVLPGVGPKTAQRMALSILRQNRSGGRQLAGVLLEAIDRIGYCRSCRTFSELELCGICQDARRDQRLLCVVESAADIFAIEHAGGYRGMYFVLHGRLSPIDGIGPESLGLDLLADRVAQGEIEEVILATNPTVEGEATAHYITESLRHSHVRLTRIAHGVPLGGELEYVDGGTIVHALMGRRSIGGTD